MGKEIDIRNLRVFEKLFEEYYPVVCAVADRFLDDEAGSQDVAQEAFLRLWDKRGELRSFHAVKSYLFTTVRNLCLNILRDNPRRLSDSAMEFPGSPDADMEPVIIEEETVQLLYRAIEKLPARSRKVMSLAVKGMKNQQIAEELGVSVNTVKTLKYNAINTLRKEVPGHSGGQLFQLLVFADLFVDKIM